MFLSKYPKVKPLYATFFKLYFCLIRQNTLLIDFFAHLSPFFAKKRFLYFCIMIIFQVNLTSLKTLSAQSNFQAVKLRLPY